MKVRNVLLDRGFVEAAIDAESPLHESVAAAYTTLLDGYVASTDRLFMLSTVLADVPAQIRNTALAPVLITRVTNQHRRAAGGVRVRRLAPDVALTLVMLHREHFHAIATTSHDYDEFDLEVVYAGPADPPDTDDVPAGYVSYRTEPLPARQSTDG